MRRFTLQAAQVWNLKDLQATLDKYCFHLPHPNYGSLRLIAPIMAHLEMQIFVLPLWIFGFINLPTFDCGAERNRGEVRINPSHILTVGFSASSPHPTHASLTTLYQLRFSMLRASLVLSGGWCRSSVLNEPSSASVQSPSRPLSSPLTLSADIAEDGDLFQMSVTFDGKLQSFNDFNIFSTMRTRNPLHVARILLRSTKT